MPGFTVYFKKPSDWADTLKIHFWQPGPPGASSTWPGIPMRAEDNGWFSHHFDEPSAWFVFNDGQGRQTNDLHRDRDGWLGEDGRWRDHPS